MKRSSNKALYGLALMIVILSVVITATGVFYTTGGEAYREVNNADY